MPAGTGASFASITLLSKSRFGYPRGGLADCPRIGPVWRVKFPSRFGRDALCCNILVKSGRPRSSTGQPAPSRIRLINGHLDSLQIRPSQRPRQISITAALL